LQKIIDTTPLAEPWRNGAIEKFNDHYRQRFLDKVSMTSDAELRIGSMAFEERHNHSYRYSKLGGKTPANALAASLETLRFPPAEPAPRLPLTKPETGRYHLVRLIRSDRKLNIFSELFSVSPDLMYEYVVATIDVKEQKLKVFLDNNQVDQFDYRLR